MVYNRHRVRANLKVWSIPAKKSSWRPPDRAELYLFIGSCRIRRRTTYDILCGPNTFLLESVKGPRKIARYSFIGIDPCATITTRGGVTEISSPGKKGLSQVHPLKLLKGLIAPYRQNPWDCLPPFQGGITGLLCYDFVHYLERLPARAANDLLLPESHFFVTDKLVAFDHAERKSWIIACPGVQETICCRSSPEWSGLYDKAEQTIEDIQRRVSDFGPERVQPDRDQRGAIEIIYEMKKSEYMRIVRRAKEYIAAGDIFQANLSQRVSADIGDRDPWKLYKILRTINPSPFAAFMHFGDYQIVSSSPERLLRVKAGTVETRPIAGTRPRGRSRSEDELMRRELLLNEKERAEHIMLIDLERNDLGRVSDYGTVRVDELMITEDYSHVIHIVSNVTGSMAAGKDCFDAIRAAFPGGTITGVPKVRCMEIIDELEPVRRGPYTGSIGYVGFSGNMDLNIVIRSFVIKDRKAFVQVGAGIVADSDPEREYYETLKKGEALIRTLETV
ncbi:MAG: anthranilate synthase component I family protein [Nitrospirota bacterium]